MINYDNVHMINYDNVYYVRMLNVKRKHSNETDDLLCTAKNI